MRKTLAPASIVLVFLFAANLFASQTLIDYEAQWSYLKGTAEASSPVTNWRTAAFNDATWTHGPAPFQYGGDNSGTILADMRGSYSCLFLRGRVQINEPATIPSLSLKVDYDDAFIVWINGTEVARSANAPASVTFNALATGPHAVGNSEEFFPPVSTLVAGTNVVAVQVFNAAIDSTQFFIDVKLKAEGDQVADTQFSVKRGFYDTPFDLAITTATPGATIKYTTDGTNPTTTSGTTYSGPITIDKTSCIRAMAFKAGMLSTNIDTHTYIFVDDVVNQPHGVAPPGWPASWGASPLVTDYGMDPNIVNSPTWNTDLKLGLRSLPVISLVMNIQDLVGPNGNYSHPGSEGPLWERPLSVERIDPNGDTKKQFQSYAGMRIRGGASSRPQNPKHNLRIIFRGEYGNSRLNFRLYEPDGADSCNEFDLMIPQSFAWHTGYGATSCILSDIFSRDCERDMGMPRTRGQFHHVFINGQYWGLYTTEERLDNSYGADYFGGEKEDYDVIKVNTAIGYQIAAVDGTMAGYTRMWQQCNAGLSTNAAYFKVQGRDPDGSVNPAYENLLDVENMLDYMLIIYYTGQRDAPISWYINGNNGVNNWQGTYNRTGKHGGFRFILHDNEASLLSADSVNVNEDRVGPSPTTFYLAGDNMAVSSPQWVFRKCADNAEFRLKVADHVQKHFFNGGALTPAKSIERWTKRKDEIFTAIVGESARWGNTARNPSYNRNDFLTVFNNHNNNYFPQRTQIAYNQLNSRLNFPSVQAPTFNQYGGDIPVNFVLTITNPQANGTIYFTLDGTDPRVIGGAIAPSAIAAAASPQNVTLDTTTKVRARIFNAGTWSAMLDYTFFTAQDFSALKITEVMYNPPKGECEFIEIKNTGSERLDLTGVSITSGVLFSFPDGTVLDPGAFKVVVADAAEFSAKYPAITPAGIFVGSLANSGDDIVLSGRTGEIFSVNYSDSTPWPLSPDGTGYSLVPVNPNLNPDPDNSTNWRASTNSGGSPGADDPLTNYQPVVINEILTHSNPPQEDYIELHNPSNDPAEIGGWFLTDSPNNPQKYRIADGTIVQPNAYLVFNESEFNNPNDANVPKRSMIPFSLDAQGDSVYLFSADASMNLTGYSNGFKFEASETGVPFGRFIISTGEPHYPAQLSQTKNAENSGPRIGPVILTEINYHPGLVGGSPGDEFVELFNPTPNTVKLYDPANRANTWKISGIDFAFPQNIEVAPNGIVIVCATDPAAFRTKYNVPGQAQVFGPFAGTLQNSGEMVSLKKPDTPTVDGMGAPVVPYIVVDEVRYSDHTPWPSEPDGTGPSLVRNDINYYANDPINWKPSDDSGGSPGVLDGLTPLQPTDLSSTATTDKTVTLEWTDRATTEDGFRVEQSSNGLNGWVQVATAGANGTTAVVTGLDGATTYYFRVYAYNGFGQSRYSNVLQVLTNDSPPPQAPIVPVATAAGSFAINLTWQSADNLEEGFRVEHSRDNLGAWEPALQTGAGQVTALDTGLEPYTVYYYRVQAYSRWGNSEYSEIASVRTDPPPPPNIPTNLAAVAITYSAIALTWDDNSPNEMKFRIQRSDENEANWIELAIVPSSSVTACSYTDTTCLGAVRYFYRITSFHDFGESEFSNTADALTPPPPPPFAPSNLATTVLSFSRVRLNWSDNSTLEAAFKIERSFDGLTAWNMIATVSANVTEYLDKNLTPVTQYYYRVKAYHPYGQSAYSNTARAVTPPPTPPAAPSQAEAVAAGVDKIDVSWIDNSNSEYGFRVERSPDGINDWVDAGNADEDATTFRDTNLQGDTLYYYRVSAFHDFGFSQLSNVASAKTAVPPPVAPTSLFAVAASDQQISLTWTAPVNTTSYKIERSPDGVNGWAQAGTSTAPSFTDGGLQASTAYYYRVFALNETGPSPASAVASATTFSAIEDADHDSYADHDEYYIYGTNPNDENSKPNGSADFDHDSVTDDKDADDDNDGVGTPDELAATTDPFNATSYPTVAMQVTKLQAKANFKTRGKDGCSASGVLPAQFTFSQTVVRINIGGAEESVTLDAKGKGKSARASVAFAANKKAPGTLTYTVKFANGAYADLWKDEGLDPARGKTKFATNFTVEIRVAGKVYAKTVPGTCSVSSTSASFTMSK